MTLKGQINAYNGYIDIISNKTNNLCLSIGLQSYMVDATLFKSVDPARTWTQDLPIRGGCSNHWATVLGWLTNLKSEMAWWLSRLWLPTAPQSLLTGNTQLHQENWLISNLRWHDGSRPYDLQLPPSHYWLVTPSFTRTCTASVGEWTNEK